MFLILHRGSASSREVRPFLRPPFAKLELIARQLEQVRQVNILGQVDTLRQVDVHIQVDAFMQADSTRWVANILGLVASTKARP